MTFRPPAASATERARRSDARRNRELVVSAALTAIHRDGLLVPMSAIAAQAGVGIGTLYRHFPAREDLYDELTFRSFHLMLDRIRRAKDVAETAALALRAFLGAVIEARLDMLLPATGGPPVTSDRTRAVQAELHVEIEELIARGRHDGTIVRPVGVWDVAWLGAMLAQPSRTMTASPDVSLRLLETYVAGLAVPDRAADA